MKRSYTRIICFSLPVILLFTYQEAKCQYYLIGDDPASVRWRQIKTPHFRVIYPVSWENKAGYIANGLEYIYGPGSESLGIYAQKTPVIIHGLTTVPSSDTYLAPRRIDFFTAPPQDTYPQDWIDQLIIHEFRHAAQYSAVRRGFTKGLSWLLGEQGTFAVTGLFLPIWFIEGDATVAETALHKTGRGRTPSFEMRLRAQFVDKGVYSYEKANYGSYKDLVPNKYELGYQLTGRTRLKYGPDIWGGVMSNVGKRPYTIVPFSSGIKKGTGFNKYHLYDTLSRELRRIWIDQDFSEQQEKLDILKTGSGKVYTSYSLPVVINDSLIAAVKSSIDDLTAIVLINANGSETKLLRTGVRFYNESLSASDTAIYWSELVNDPRWLLRDYRVIKSYSLNSGKLRQISFRTRYYSPSVSKDGRMIAAVDVSPENQYSLVILNAADGSLIKRISTPENLLFIHPRWSDDAKKVVSVVFGSKGNSLAITDIGTSVTEILIPFSLMEMKRPSLYNNYVLYTASYSGKDNIYALDLVSRDVFRITSARFGASDASVNTGENCLLYSDYTSDGYRIVRKALTPEAWTRTTIPLKSAFPLAEQLSDQEQFTYNADSVPKISYASKPFSKILHLFNFHSWAPIGIDFQNFTATPGITLISQNLLGTTVTETGYQYNRNEKTGKYFFSLSDETLYPAIDLRFDYGGRKDFGVYIDNDSIPEKWKELNLSAGIRLPLNWTHNAWIRRFEPAVKLDFKNLNMDQSVPVRFPHENMVATTWSVMVSNTLTTSLRDIYPKWRQILQINYNNTPFSKSKNSLFAGQLTLNLPGIGEHHGLMLYGSFQKRVEDWYPFEDLILLPKGYTELSRNEIHSFSATYTMPLFYPEWQIGHTFYFKRFKTSLFYDFAGSNDPVKPDFFSTAGFDLTSDFSLFNFIVPFDAGVRSMYIPESKSLKFEVLFAVKFGEMY